MVLSVQHIKLKTKFWIFSKSTNKDESISDEYINPYEKIVPKFGIRRKRRMGPWDW